jgi:membrane protease YdiL (CAAX protease family)
MLTPLDHILALIIVVAWPLYAALVQFPRLKRGVAAGIPGIRIRVYVQAIITQWVVATFALFIWSDAQRSVADLGFALVGGWRLLLGFVVLVTAIILLESQRRRVTTDRELQDSFRKKVETASPILPVDGKELFYFHLVSVTAGICEELLYRGFLIWYLTQIFGLAAAVVLSSVLFGMAHLYQGRKGILQTGVVGLVFALVYVATGSLWAPMLLHTLIDMNSGLLWYQVTHLQVAETREPNTDVEEAPYATTDEAPGKDRSEDV